MKRILLAALGLLALGGSAIAQVNVVPQVGLTTGYYAKVTYSSAFYGLVPVVTSGTDEVCIAGSATKTIRIQRIRLWGTTATAAQTLPVQLIKRNSADTGGTAATTTANPGVTTQIASLDTGQATNLSATATLISYTAAPTVVDTAPVYIDSQLLNMPLGLTTTQAPGVVDFNFALLVEDNVQAATLRGANQQVCINIGSAITNASVWNGSILWTEE